MRSFSASTEKSKWRRVKVYARIIGSRLLLILHGLYCIFKTHPEVHPTVFFLLVPICLIPIEAWLTWRMHKGKEWKWICPCVILYFMATLPALIILEVDLAKIQISAKNETNVTIKVNLSSAVKAESENIAYKREHQLVTKSNVHSTHMEAQLFNINISESFSLLQELRILEQLMLLILIISRWIMPRQQITAEQKSALLMTYFGMAADILELYDSFNETIITYKNLVMTKVLLCIWTFSILQFVFVFSARKEGRSGTLCGLYFETEIWAIFLNLILQDAPFLGIRVYLIHILMVEKKKSISYGSVFFLVKNVVMTLLIFYRIFAIITGIRKEQRDAVKFKSYYLKQRNKGNKPLQTGGADRRKLSEQPPGALLQIPDKTAFVSYLDEEPRNKLLNPRQSIRQKGQMESRATPAQLCTLASVEDEDSDELLVMEKFEDKNYNYN